MAIAALAINYMNFKNVEDLQIAKDLFAFVQNNSKSCATEGAYVMPPCDADICWNSHYNLQ